MSADWAIAPTDFRDFLKAHGWSLLEQALRDRLYVLENKKFPSRQLVFPMDLSAPDYMESVDLAITKLSTLTDQSTQAIATKIHSLKDDVLRLRVFFDGNDNVLPLSFAGALVNSTEKLLKSAACTALRPRTHHPRLTLNEASQFVDAARFGQTELGSFVLRVACPINSMEAQGSLDLGGEDAPFVRQVTLVLQRALSQLTTAIEADTLDILVEDLKGSSAPLISSNLCEAIAGMHDDQVNNSLDIGFDWSVMRRTPDGISDHPIRIQRDYFSRIEEVRRELRAQDLHEEDAFIGTVERLDGEMSTDGRRSGQVVLSLLLPDEGETVRVRTVLSADDYAKADRAHMTNGAYVRVVGRLRPGRQPRQLTDMSSFELLG
ncbi:hypothetical protein [Burkholderia ambifaria]|uniref:hypothetical protein n=1 Tax=Burkholderia ambifaria TaxID=152480 RepID=UPI0015887924|nr:hypothetical protein [Burkholderia ambifaria]WDR90338.1 hypothetical protein OR986_15820 [Burkholderia ambifaria]WDS03193.1 hypothetical protein OR985_20800 [Burkholderia ambifaria]